MTGSLLQASCVAIEGRGILIEGEPGSGKSSLALALIDRGAELVGDDGVALETRAGELWASPPPNTAGKLEIRNVGIVEMSCVEARVVLLLRLDREAERFVEEPEWTDLAEARVPMIRLWPGSPVIALRAEWALKLHGLA